MLFLYAACGVILGLSLVVFGVWAIIATTRQDGFWFKYICRIFATLVTIHGGMIGMAFLVEAISYAMGLPLK